MVALWGVLGYWSVRPPSTLGGVVAASAVVFLVVGAWSMWRRRSERHPLPATEYLAVVWLLAYVVLLGVSAGQRDVNVLDSLFLLPPVSIAPSVTRLVIGDDGDPNGRARSAAQWLHRILGWALTTWGVVFVISIFFIYAAVLPLIPGILHLRAATSYRAARLDAEEEDPATDA